eukprot:3365678-Pyramimonas_sp.AAC.1
MAIEVPPLPPCLGGLPRPKGWPREPTAGPLLPPAAGLEGSPSSELAALRAELRAERAELRGELAALRGELAALRRGLQAKRATRPRGAGDSTARPARLDSGVAPKDPVEFIATLRRAHAGRRADPQG